MPDQETLERAREDAREGKSPSTQAGEFVREEMHHVREGKHGAKSAKQVVAIGLSKARRAGVKLGTPKGRASTKQKAAQDTRAAKKRTGKKSNKRSRATTNALKREPRSAASHRAVSRQTKSAAARRGKQNRRKAAMKAVQTRKRAA